MSASARQRSIFRKGRERTDAERAFADLAAEKIAGLVKTLHRMLAIELEGLTTVPCDYTLRVSTTWRNNRALVAATLETEAKTVQAADTFAFAFDRHLPDVADRSATIADRLWREYFGLEAEG